MSKDLKDLEKAISEMEKYYENQEDNFTDEEYWFIVGKKNGLSLANDLLKEFMR